MIKVWTPATPARLLVQMLVHRSWTSRPVAGTAEPVTRIDGRAALTLPEAARWLGLTVPCVSALIDRGELPSLRDTNGSVRISAGALIAWTGSVGRGNPPPTPQ
jgi:excisionase family DNA binding protein